MVEELHRIKDRARALLEKRRSRFDERGQLTPHERLVRILDPGMPFLELYGLANYMVDTDDREKSIPGASALAGIGYISGVRCMIYASVVSTLICRVLGHREEQSDVAIS